MYFHETIFSLVLVICVGGLLYPYVVPGAGALIRLTSLYRPISLTCLFLYSLIIVLQPTLGSQALLIVPLFAMIGVCCIALELRTLRKGAAGRVSQMRIAAITIGMLTIGFSSVAFLPLPSAIILVNMALAGCFSWATVEGVRLWRARPSFTLLAIFISCAFGVVGMVTRAYIYAQQEGDVANLVFPEPDGTFIPRMMASFAAIFTAIVLNYEHLARLARLERNRANEVDARLFSTLAGITQQRSKRAEHASQAIGLCSEFLAEALIKEEWRDVRYQPDLPGLLRRAASVADIGLIGVPDHVLDTSAQKTADVDLFTRHPVIGRNFFNALARGRARTTGGHASTDQLVAIASDVAGSYCEHWDGSGFPDGKIGTRIPVAGRIVAVARAYVELVGPVPSAQAHADALDGLRAGRRGRFDPMIVDVLIDHDTDILRLITQAKGDVV